MNVKHGAVLATVVVLAAAAGDLRADSLRSRLTSPYQAPTIRSVGFTNSPRLHDLIRAGRMYLSLEDAIALAIENNLDVEYQRFNRDSSGYELLRARGGGVTRGLNLAVSEAPTGVGGPSAPLVTSPATRTAAGSSVATNPIELGGLGQVQSNLSIVGPVNPSSGTAIPIFDPDLFARYNWQHQSAPQTNPVVQGVENLVTSTNTATAGYRQGFSSGLQLTGQFDTSRQALNSQRASYSPYSTANAGLTFVQPLLRGFGFAANRRYIEIAKNENKMADALFRQQLIASVYGVTRLYYDLVALTQDVAVKEQSLAFTTRLLEDTRAQFEQGTAAQVEVARANAQLYSARQDLERSKGLLEEQEAVMKTYLSRRGISDPLLQAVDIVPTTGVQVETSVPDAGIEESPHVEDVVQQALQSRGDTELAQLQVANLNLSYEGAKSALRPQLDLVGTAQNTGLAGQLNPFAATPDTSFVGGYGSALGQLFRRNYPIYGIGVQLDLPLRNRVAQADAARDQVLIRQGEIRYQQLQNQVRLEVEDALISLRRARSAWQAAIEARKLQEQSLEIEQARYSAGVSTSFFVLQYQSLLAQSRLSEVVSRNAYLKAEAALERASGTILEKHGVSVSDATKTR